jgi:hypothetical protein
MAMGKLYLFAIRGLGMLAQGLIIGAIAIFGPMMMVGRAFGLGSTILKA